MGGKELKIIRFLDDALLMVKSEDDPQKILHKFSTTSKKCNIIISPKKHKTIFRCRKKTIEI